MLHTRLLALLAAIACLAGLSARAADPMSTSYSLLQCEGSLQPYPADISPAEYPDTLVPVMINHVGRHGARYPASATHTRQLLKALHRADSLGTITPTGRQLLDLAQRVARESDHRWGALDSLGCAEQRAIASRMIRNFAPAFKDASVHAISSYSPRAMMSMYEFTNQLDRLDNSLEFTTTTGRQNSPLMRPFDLDADYKAFRDSPELKDTYQVYFLEHCPTAPIVRALGEAYPFADEKERQELSLTEYYVVAGCRAMMIDPDAKRFFSIEEANALWSCFNLRQYLQWTATTLSRVPADMATALVQDIIDTTDEFLASPSGKAAVRLRFGHAETLMPLLSLLHLPGCYYMTNYFDTVAQHWRDFAIVPMAANLQIIIFRSTVSGLYYARVDLNERPIAAIPGSDAIYPRWKELRGYMLHCLPIYAF